MIKYTFKMRFILFLFVILMFLSPICMASGISPTSSTNNTMTNSISTDNSLEGTYQFIASDVYKFEQDATIDSMINGNAFAFGNNVTVTGEIAGDVFAFGNTVMIAENTYVHGNIFVFANQFVMNGVCYDIYGATSSFTLGEKAIVARDIRVAADKIHISGQIKRNAYISTNELLFPENAKALILGNLNYEAPSEFTINENIAGGVIKFTPEVTDESTIAEKITSFITGTMSSLLYTLAIILLVIWLAPNFKNKSSEIFKKKLPLSLGIGLLASIFIIIGAFILLLITNGLCFNISLAVTTIFILALTISQAVFAMGCAKYIAEKKQKDNLPMFIGITLLVILALHIIGLIPFVGGLVEFLAIMTGFGMILVHLIFKDKLTETETDTKVSE